jgi:SAM-dependent methyltransferase
VKTAVTDVFERRFCHPRPGRTLIVGSRIYREREDRRRRYPDAVGVDMQDGPGVDRVLDLQESPPSDLGTFEHVECQSVLEHAKRPWLLAENLERLMRPGATLFVTVPFMWRIHAYPDDFWRFTPAAVALLFPSIDWVALRLCHWEIEEWDAVKIPVRQFSTDDVPTPWFPRTEVLGFGRRQ